MRGGAASFNRLCAVAQSFINTLGASASTAHACTVFATFPLREIPCTRKEIEGHDTPLSVYETISDSSKRLTQPETCQSLFTYLSLGRLADRNLKRDVFTVTV